MEQICELRVCDPDQPAALAVRLGDGGPEEQRNALKFARLALANDPASPFRWCDLGDLYMDLRGPAQGPTSAAYVREARACYRRAEELAPGNPDILQRIANFHFQVGEPEEALKRTYRVLERVRDFDDIIFSTYNRFGVSQAEVLAHGVPLEPEPVRSYLRFVIARKDLNAASAAWNWATAWAAGARAASPVVTEGLAKSYVNLLWRQGEFALAARTWAGYLGESAGDYLRPNRIFNGGFERAFSEDNPLDWSPYGIDGVQMDRDTQVHEQGQASMRVTFLGTRNLDLHHFGQTQPVAAGAYRFRAMVKTQAITTDQGVRLRIYDPEAPARLDISTPAMTGTSDWHAVELRVEVRVPTRLLRVEVARQPSLKFDSKIAGMLWLDAVSLTPAN